MKDKQDLFKAYKFKKEAEDPGILQNIRELVYDRIKSF